MNQSVKELKALGKERGIKGYYKLRKVELIEVLDNPPPPRNIVSNSILDETIPEINVPDQFELIFDGLILSQKCAVCKQTKPADSFNTIKRNGDTKLSESCISCNQIKTKEKNEQKEKEFAHLWTREDGSKITDPYEIVDDNEPRRCNLCHAWKLPKEFSIIGLINPRLTKGCLEQNKKVVVLEWEFDNPEKGKTLH